MADVFLPAGSAQGKPAVEDVTFLVGGTYTVAIVPVPEEAGANPRNYQDDLGQYHVVSIVGEDGHLKYWRADFSTPASPAGWAVAHEIDGVEDASFPVVTVETVNRSTLVLWQHKTADGPPPTYEALEALSNDDGETWGEPTVAFAGGKYPAIWVGVDSSIMRGAVVGGGIKLNYQAPGDASPGAAFDMVDETGAAIAVNDDTFGLSQETNDSTLRWTAELSVDGETATSTWESFDEGASWRRVT